MKRLIPTYDGHPILNDDLLFIQNAFSEYLISHFKDLVSANDWVIISGLEMTDNGPSGFTWTDGFVWNTSTKKLFYVLENTIPTPVNPSELTYQVYLDQPISGGTVENELQVTTQVQKWDYVELRDGAPATDFADTPRLSDVIVTMGGGIKSIIAAGGILNQETTWQTASLLAGWSGTAKYRRTKAGVIELSAQVSRSPITTTGEAVIFNLPVGFRPTVNGLGRLFVCVENGASGSGVKVWVASSGDVFVDYPNYTAANDLRLDNIVFGGDN